MSENLVNFIDKISENFADKPGLLFKPGFKYVSWTYKQLGDDSKKAASYLKSLGLEKNDRVIIWAPNSPMWVISFFACVRAGVILVPLDIKSPPEFVDTVIAKTNPKLVLLSRFTPVDSHSLDVPVVYLEDLPNLLKDQNHFDPIDISSDDVVEVMFTSGTTGDPKGVILTHQNLMSNLDSVSKTIRGKSSDRLLSILPLSHMFEQMGGMLFPLKIGADITYITSRRPKAIFKTMQDRKVTVMLLVPQALDLFKNGIEREINRQGKTKTFQFLMRQAERMPKVLRKLFFSSLRKQMGGSLRLIFAGGAPLKEPVGKWWNLLGIDVIQGYGATEASPVIACHPESNPRFDSPGPPLPGVDVRISPDGEVLVRGLNITPGYWEDDEKTSESFQDEWYKTGDQGFIDRNGFLILNGRKKDMIVLANGQNVFPEDIESVLVQHESVTDAAVVGIETDDDTEVHAALILENSGLVKEIISWANSQLASHQRIRNHTIWEDDDFPRTHTLKVKKPLVIDTILNGFDENESPQDEIGLAGENPLIKLISELSGISANTIKSDQNIGSDIGLDSLGRVELLSAIEEDLDVFIDDGDISSDTTVADLELLVATSEKATKQKSRKNWGLNIISKVVRNLVQSLFLFPLLRVSYRIKIIGRQNLDSVNGPSLLIGNHVLHLDHVIYIRALPSDIRQNLAVAAGAHLYNNFLMGFLITLLGNAFPFATAKAERTHSQGNVRESLDNMGKIMDQGWSVLIFPEGELTIGGPTKPFLPGTGLMAIAGNLPVIPMGITIEKFGYPNFLPLFKRGEIEVTFGEPILPPWDADPEKVTQILQESVEHISN